MKITLKKIESLSPCKNRLENFVQHNPDFKGSVRDFLSLDTITYTDKTWVCTRLMTRNQRFYWARACARSVLEIFETKRPNDSRVRDLLDYLDTIKSVEKLTSAQISKIRDLHTSAYAAADDAYAAAYAAAHAAAAAAAYADAADAAAYAADAAYAAANAAAADARMQQEEYNLIILAEIMEMNI